MVILQRKQATSCNQMGFCPV